MTPILFFISVILLGLIVLILLSRVKKKIPPHEVKVIRHKWRKIQEENTENYEKILFEADKLLDYALGKMGFSGSLSEKLKKAGPRFSNINGLWAAHTLRNKLAHDIDFESRDEISKKAVREFEKAFKDLKCL